MLEDAVKRGGRSSWFNRIRASLNRARRMPALIQESGRDDYSTVILRAFDDLLERLGATGTRFERWYQAFTDKLQSVNHDQYREGLEQLGRTLGYNYVSRPRHGAATDCRWRGVYGNTKEVITFETKIEQATSQQIVASDMGQAHNQLSRAQREYEAQGYIVRGTIITHLSIISPEAEASAGSIKVLEEAAIKFDQILSLENENLDINVSKMLANDSGAECRPYRSRTCDTLIKSHGVLV